MDPVDPNEAREVAQPSASRTVTPAWQFLLVVALLIVFVAAWSAVGVQRSRNQKDKATELAACNKARLDALARGGPLPECK